MSTGFLRSHYLPADVLVPYMQRRWNRISDVNTQSFQGSDPMIFEAVTGMSRGIWHRIMRCGVTFEVADKIATALGYHPCLIWGDAWWQATDYYEEDAA